MSVVIPVLRLVAKLAMQGRIARIRIQVLVCTAHAFVP